MPPYWTRFGDFFRYPLRGEPLLICLGVAAGSGVASLLFMPIHALIDAVLMVVVLRYAFKVLERTARGYIEDDLICFESAHGGKNLPYKQFVVILVGLAICGYMGSLFGSHVAVLLLALFTLVLPANTMILAITDDLGESMSPAKLWGVMRGIGTPYLGLCACLFLLLSSSGGLLRLLMPVIPMLLVAAVGGALGTYFIIVMFRLMGYVLYEYHEILGMDVSLGFDRQSSAVKGVDPVDERTQALVSLLKEGRCLEAVALMKDEVAQSPDSQSANQRLHRLLLAVPGQEREMLEHASRWLGALVDARQDEQAVEVLDGIWKLHPEYSPPHPTQVLALGRACFDRRRYESAGRLMQGFDRRFPGKPEIPAAYVLGARLLIDYRRDEEQARRVLAAVLAYYPESPAAKEAQQLVALLDRLAAVGAEVAPA